MQIYFSKTISSFIAIIYFMYLLPNAEGKGGRDKFDNDHVVSTGYSQANSKQNQSDASTPNKTKNLQERASRFVNLYFFNVTNPDNVTPVSKPNLQQVGPYKYKIELIEDLNNKSRTYKYVRNYTFQYEKSNRLNDSDRINIINIPYIVLAQKIAHASEVYKADNETSKMMAAISTTIILRNISVAEIVSKGIDVQHFHDKLSDFNMSILQYPVAFADHLFKLFPGELDIEVISAKGTGKVHSISSISNGSYEVGCWRDNCNMIRGMDGFMMDTEFPPIPNETTILSLFYPDLYRSIDLIFMEEINDLYVYSPVQNLFNNRMKNRSKNCFCVTTDCQRLRSGVLDVSSCKNDFPLVYSLPHLLEADKRYLRTFDGLKPDKRAHESFYRIDPITGEVLYSIRRLQMNIWLKSLRAMNNSDYVYRSNGLENSIFPILWTEEVYVLLQKIERKNSSVVNLPTTTKPLQCTCAKNYSNSIHYSFKYVILQFVIYIHFLATLGYDTGNIIAGQIIKE